MSRTLLEGREERKQKEALVWETWINSQQAPALLLSVVIKELAWSQLSARSCDGAEGMAAALLPGQIRQVRSVPVLRMVQWDDWSGHFQGREYPMDNDPRLATGEVCLHGALRLGRCSQLP